MKMNYLEKTQDQTEVICCLLEGNGMLWQLVHLESLKQTDKKAEKLREIHIAKNPVEEQGRKLEAIYIVNLLLLK